MNKYIFQYLFVVTKLKGVQNDSLCKQQNAFIPLINVIEDLELST